MDLDTAPYLRHQHSAPPGLPFSVNPNPVPRRRRAPV
jgi:hypothetical protein